jgi:hypothetical protein
MRFLSQFALLSVTSVAVAFGQNPEPTLASDPSKRGEKPLTPAELRERQIQMRDPLSKVNPIATNEGEAAETTPAPAPLIRPQPSAAPLPGSLAESNLLNSTGLSGSGPRVVPEGAEPVAPEYNGPAVLSRSYTISRPALPHSVKWTPTVGFNEIYDNGLLQTATTPGAQPGQVGSLGYGLTWSVRGQHTFKRDLLMLDYHGDMSRYGSNSNYNGTNQSLNFSLRHMISRRVSLTYTSVGSILSRNSSLIGPLETPGSVASLNLAATPTSQIVDEGTRQWLNQVGVAWQKSSRLSFNAGGGLFFVDRTGANSISNSGIQAQGEVNYRLTRKTTVGSYYSFTSYTYSHQLNVANFHTVGGIYSYSLNRGTEIRVRAGVSAIESQGQQLTTISPDIAVLLGRSSGVVEFYNRSLVSDISAQFIKDLGRRRTVNIAYARGISPGNGQMLTSTQDSITGRYSMRLFRDYILDLSAGRISLASVSGTGVSSAAGKYDSMAYGAGVSRTYSRGINGFLRFDYRTFNVLDQQGVSGQMRITTGFTWSPPVEGWLK